METGKNYCERIDNSCGECDYCRDEKAPDGMLPPPGGHGSGGYGSGGYGSGNKDGSGSGSGKEDLFEGCPFGPEEYYEMMRLPEEYRKQVEAEFRESGVDTSQCDLRSRYEVRQEIFHDRFFTEEDEYGRRESLVRQRDLNITLDADRYGSFAPEEMRSIYGNAGIGSRVNVLSF